MRQTPAIARREAARADTPLRTPLPAFGAPSARVPTANASAQLQSAQRFGFIFGAQAPPSTVVQLQGKNRFERQWQRQQKRRELEQAARHQRTLERNPLPPRRSPAQPTEGNPLLGTLLLLMTLGAAAAEVQNRTQTGTGGSSGGQIGPPGRTGGTGTVASALTLAQNITTPARNVTDPVGPGGEFVHVEAAMPGFSPPVFAQNVTNTSVPTTHANFTQPPQPSFPASPAESKPSSPDLDAPTILPGGGLKLSKSHQAAFDQGGGKRAYVESQAIKNLLNSTQTGGQILQGLAEAKLNPTLIRTKLQGGGEAHISKSDRLLLNSERGYVPNAIVAAHEMTHQLQFEYGQVQKTSTPYTMAAAEIPAKLAGLNTYQELVAGKYLEPGKDKDTQDQEFDLKDYQKDPQAYKRQVFRRYLSQYRKGDTRKYPDFTSDKALDAHIGAQEEYFKARQELYRAQKKVLEHCRNPRGVPQDLHEQYRIASLNNREAKRRVDETLKFGTGRKP